MFEIYNRVNNSTQLLKSIKHYDIVFKQTMIQKKFIKKIIYENDDGYEDFLKKIFISVFKPKNQFYFNIFNRKQFSYSTGLILKALEFQTRSSRRNKAGSNIFFTFLLKKLELIKRDRNGGIFFFLKNLNNYNSIKNYLIKYSILWKKKFCILIKIGKNYNRKNYKKVSYINKRLRKRFILE